MKLKRNIKQHATADVVGMFDALDSDYATHLCIKGNRHGKSFGDPKGWVLNSKQTEIGTMYSSINIIV